MWLSASAPVEELWAGELELDTGTPETSYRSAGDDPSTTVTASRPSVSVGRPEAFELRELFAGRELPALTASRLQQDDYYLVRLSCSFRPRDGERIDWARFAARLHPAPAGDVVAMELYPLDVRLHKRKNVKVALKTTLAFGEIAHVSPEVAYGTEYEELVPVVSAAGVGESIPSWDFRSDKGWQMVTATSKLMHMLVRAPKRTRPVSATLSVAAQIGNRRYRFPLAGARTNKAALDVTLWPPRSD